VIFKGKKSTIFAIILRPFEKWKNYQDNTIEQPLLSGFQHNRTTIAFWFSTL
jgi:hypothetical protein